MSDVIKLTIKHGGRAQTIEVNATATTTDLKARISVTTGVPQDRMKVMSKAGLLKDHIPLSETKITAGQVLTVIGTPGPLPSQPQLPSNLASDDIVTEFDHAGPPGLVNLGQTCYLNSTLQLLGQMPELRVALTETNLDRRSAESRLAMSVQDLFHDMERSPDALNPFVLLNNLRLVAPQFAEQDGSGRFAQQDADEAWTRILSAFRSGTLEGSAVSSAIEDHLSIELTKRQRCLENDEPETTSLEKAYKLDCVISINTNHLMSGLQANLDEKIEKRSPLLDRMASYEQTARLSKLPTYLVIHMVRFYWRRDIGKKAKIMRKVAFPQRLDLFHLLADDLREKTHALNTMGKDILNRREERRSRSRKAKGQSDQMSERDIRASELAQVQQLSSRTFPDGQRGGNPTALYDLCGMVTHKGASADSGHYIAWARKEASPDGGNEGVWYKFDDDKVTEADERTVLAMDGGGEASSAYILLYRSAIV